MSERARLAFVSLFDARDPNAYSGAPHAMHRELSKHFDVLDWFPLNPIEEWAFVPARLLYKFAGAHYEPMREPSFLHGVARILEARAKQERPDLIFAPSSVATSCFEGETPVFWAADLCFGSYLETYVRKPARRFVQTGHVQESQSVMRARRINFPTHWAAEGAIARHGASRSKIDVIPWGANLPFAVPRDMVTRAIETRSAKQCEIVFIGRDWYRKGGDLVLEVVRILNREGLPTKLTIIGCVPPGSHDSALVYPFLDKSRPDHWAILKELMLRAHFFLMPSRAEAFGHVFCEASAFGVPSLGSRTGGIPDVIQDGLTGFATPQSASAESIAELIMRTFNDRPRYRRMALAARDDYENRLNWEKFGEKLSVSLYSAIGGSAQSQSEHRILSAGRS